jgi:hypothetical protein
MLLLFLKGLVGDVIAEYIVPLILSTILTVIILLWTVVWFFGMIAQPGGIWLLASQAAPEVQAEHPLTPQRPSDRFDPHQPDTPIPPFTGPLPVFEPGPGRVSDVDRYRLAVAAGFVGQEAILAVAISIAENGSGVPDVVSRPNWNNTVDIGLWQINSAHIGSSGIVSKEWLFVPINNARAAFAIRARQGWCAWSTYEAACGPGHNGAYAGNINRARQAAAQGGN